MLQTRRERLPSLQIRSAMLLSPRAPRAWGNPPRASPELAGCAGRPAAPLTAPRPARPLSARNSPRRRYASPRPSEALRAAATPHLARRLGGVRQDAVVAVELLHGGHGAAGKGQSRRNTEPATDAAAAAAAPARAASSARARHRARSGRAPPPARAPRRWAGAPQGRERARHARQRGGSGSAPAPQQRPEWAADGCAVASASSSFLFCFLFFFLNFIKFFPPGFSSHSFPRSLPSPSASFPYPFLSVLYSYSGRCSGSACCPLSS